MVMKMKCSVCVALMIACVGLSQAAVVSYDKDSPDITGLGSNVNSTPNSWTTADSVWNTTDEIVPAIGSQASFKAAIGILPGQRKIAQIQASSGKVFVGGNEDAAATPPPTSPYTTLVGFDTSVFGSGVLKSISMTLQSRVGTDSMDVRWFVEAGGNTYVSDIIDTVAGSAVTLTLPDASAIPWFVFDAHANIGSAIGDANSLMELTNVTHVGYHTASRFTTNANWHGAYLSNFSASTIQFTATDPDPADGALVFETPILNWTAGDLANAHDIYLDTVNPPAAYMGRQTETSYEHDPNLLPGTYYWRIDEVDDPNIAVGDPGNVWEGDVWSFEIANPGLPTHPNPADGATGVGAAPTLSWTAGLGAVSRDIWFGTSPDALTLVSDDQADTSYAPGALIKGQTYYWAVDEYDGTNTYVGPVWSFTVAPLTGTTSWTKTNAGPGSNLWNIEANWDLGVPGVGTQANIHVNGTALIDSSVEAVATGNWARWGVAADPNLGVIPALEMTGGSLTLKALALGNGGPTIVNISGGTMKTNNVLMGDNDYGHATLNINGGTVDIATLTCKTNKTTNFVNVNGGVLTATGLNLLAGIDPNYLGTTVNVAGGTMILAGDLTSTVSGYVTSGRIIAYGGAGSIFLNYDAGTNKTTVTGCPFVLEADLTNDCAVNIDDLQLVVQNWLFATPVTADWSFDMASDPVGTGMFDLKVRNDDPANGNYTMGDDTGTGTLKVTGAGTLLLDQQFEGTTGKFDTDVHYVIKSTNEYAVDLWIIMATSGVEGRISRVGISTYGPAPADPNQFQTVEIWAGLARQQGGYAPAVVETGFAPDAYLTIDVNYDYDTDTYDWTMSDGTITRQGFDVPYTDTGNGDGGGFTLKSGSYGGGAGNAAPGSALIDQLDITIHGSELVIKPGDADADGKVDLLDFAAVAGEWLLDGGL